MRLLQIPNRMAKAGVIEYKHFAWKVNRLIRRQAIVQSRQGKFQIRFADKAISRELYCHGHFEYEWYCNTINYLRNELGALPARPEGLIVDIGANIGVISIGALNRNDFSHAIAIEPEPRNFEALKSNVARNGMGSRFDCLRLALSDSENQLNFELSQDNYGDHRVCDLTLSDVNPKLEHYGESTRERISVPAKSLDAVLEPIEARLGMKASLIWIDIQGYEGYAFRGAKKSLSRGTPVVSEIAPYLIHRTSMSRNEFCRIAEATWQSFFVWRRSSFVRYPISLLSGFYDELEKADAHDNVIFL